VLFNWGKIPASDPDVIAHSSAPAEGDPRPLSSIRKARVMRTSTAADTLTRTVAAAAG
jgi:hypothetical protein